MAEERIRKRMELKEWVKEKYPLLNYTIDGNNLEAGAAEVFTHFFPKWDRSKMHLHQFTDGITNKLYKVHPSPAAERKGGLHYSRSFILCRWWLNLKKRLEMATRLSKRLPSCASMANARR